MLVLHREVRLAEVSFVNLPAEVKQAGQGGVCSSRRGVHAMKLSGYRSERMV